jgi:hypothetical protein
MSEEIRQVSMESKDPVPYSLRTASADDLEFLFDVSTKAMESVDAALNPSRIFDRDEKLKQ